MLGVAVVSLVLRVRAEKACGRFRILGAYFWGGVIENRNGLRKKSLFSLNRLKIIIMAKKINNYNIIITNSFMKGIWNLIPATNRSSGVFSVAAVLHLQFVLIVTLFRAWNTFCTVGLILSELRFQCPIFLFFLLHYNCYYYNLWAGIAQSLQPLAVGLTVRGSKPCGGNIFRNRPHRCRCPPSLFTRGSGFASRGVKRPGCGVEISPSLAQRLKKEYNCTYTS
jgi:hypothetical protein